MIQHAKNTLTFSNLSIVLSFISCKVPSFAAIDEPSFEYGKNMVSISVPTVDCHEGATVDALKRAETSINIDI